MARYIKMKLGNSSVLIETMGTDAIEENSNQFAEHRGKTEEKVIEKLDQALDNLIQQQIVEHCKLLEGAFEQLKTQSLLPKKASFEFGLQFNAEGNICIAKVGGQSSFKISFEWEF